VNVGRSLLSRPLAVLNRTVRIWIVQNVDHVLERGDAELDDLFAVFSVDLIGRAFAPATSLRLALRAPSRHFLSFSILENGSGFGALIGA